MRPEATSPARSAATSSSSRGDERAAHVPVLEDAQQLQGRLGGGGAVVGHPHDRVDGRQQAPVGRQRGGVVTGEELVGHRAQLGAARVPGHGHEADGAVGQPAEVGRVVAGVERQPGVTHDPDPSGEVSDGVLDGDDGVPLGGASIGLRGDRGPGATRDVVEHHRQVGRLHHLTEVMEDPGLGRLAVVRRHQQHPVRADLLGLPGQLHGVRGGVGADAGHHPGPVADRVLHRLQDHGGLGHRRRRRLPGRAGHHDPVVAVRDQVFGDPRRALRVDRPVVVERGGHRREDGAERSYGHDLRLSVPRPGQPFRRPGRAVECAP